uniref:MARVEL domain-containing protein n=1 Tax=Strongyloides papillosus TaxID=174720 RepID=A0A0N5BWC6_STREA
MEDSRVSSSFYVPDILSPKILVTVKTVTILVGGIMLLLGDFLLLLAHSLNSKFLGNDLDYEAISYYINFGGRQIFYCINFGMIIIFMLAVCYKSKNLSIVYNCFSVIQIFGIIIWYVTLVLAIFARTILEVKDEPRKENRGLILITIVFSYEIIYHFFSFIFMKEFIKYLRRYNPKVGYGFDSTIEIDNGNISNNHLNCKSFFPTRNDSINIQNVSWLKSNDYLLKNNDIQYNNNGVQNSTLNYTQLPNHDQSFNFMPNESANFPVNTNIFNLNNSKKPYCKSYDSSWQSDC